MVGESTVNGGPSKIWELIVRTTLPVVAPAGTATTIVVSLQLIGVAAVPLKATVLVPCTSPKLTPVMVTVVPGRPETGEMPLNVGGPGVTINVRLELAPRKFASPL
jgi:hypothetical protein